MSNSPLAAAKGITATADAARGPGCLPLRPAFYFFPHTAMGQYFKAVNLDKQEIVCPWCIDGGAKLWEWAANTQGAIFTLLLRQSDGSGGGDYYGYQKGFNEGGKIPNPDDIVGSWAGDRVALVGDYDSSKLWDRLDDYRNVSRELVEAWNSFIDLPEKKIKYKCCSTCSEARARNAATDLLTACEDALQTLQSAENGKRKAITIKKLSAAVAKAAT